MKTKLDHSIESLNSLQREMSDRQPMSLLGPGHTLYKPTTTSSSAHVSLRIIILFIACTDSWKRKCLVQATSGSSNPGIPVSAYSQVLGEVMDSAHSSSDGTFSSPEVKLQRRS